MDIKIPYAFEKNTNELKYIKDVTTGLDCNCYCKTCGEDLIAKNKGAVKKPHFAHTNESKCNSRETLLHYLVKNIFADLKYIYLPIIPSVLRRFSSKGSIFYCKANLFCTSDKIHSSFLPIKNIRIEKRLDSIIPDIIATLTIYEEDYDFLIEVAVTHFIDDNKRNFIKRNNLCCIEIDMQDIYKNHILWNKEDVKSIFQTENHLSWICMR